jgi:hypothetical protein
MKEITKLGLMVGVVAAAWFLPIGEPRVQGSILEAFAMLHEYAREHILLCLVPAFFIAGAIGVFVSQASVMKYLGAGASKWISYPVAAVSGTILAVCSCTVLPLFSGIHKRGAGLGPATAFLYSGPAINALAIILTARVLGLEMGIARAVGAVVFAVVIGLSMHLVFRKEEEARMKAAAVMPESLETPRRLWQDGLYFGAMVAFLVFANWGRPAGETSGFWYVVWSVKWYVTGFLAVALAGMIWRWFHKEELGDWVSSTWTFAKQIMPLLLAGVLVAGLLLGRPGHEGLIPSEWVSRLVGGNSIQANLFASVVGAFMYFATLTEVPILQGLIGSGMGKGPALTLLLAGPALSLPSMIVIRSVLGTRKTLVYVSLVVVMSTVVGFAYGAIF